MNTTQIYLFTFNEQNCKKENSFRRALLELAEKSLINFRLLF